MGGAVDVPREQDTQVQDQDHGHCASNPSQADERTKSRRGPKVHQLGCHCPRPDGELQRSYQFSRR